MRDSGSLAGLVPEDGPALIKRALTPTVLLHLHHLRCNNPIRNPTVRAHP